MEQYYQQHDEREVLCFYYFSAAQARPLFKQQQNSIPSPSMNYVTMFYTFGDHWLARNFKMSKYIALDSTNKTASIKFPLVIWGVENSMKKLVKLQCYGVQMSHLCSPHK